MTRALAWIGRRARWVLCLGIVIAFVLPEASRVLRPALPFLVATVLALAMVRVNLASELREAIRPRRLALLVLLSVLMMPVSGGLFLLLARLAHLDADLTAALVFLGATPPIASAANLCFILGLNARLALEVAVAANLLTPLLGPLTVELFLPGEAPLAPGRLALNLGLIIAGGAAMAVAIRRLVGADRVNRNDHVFDGLAVVVLVAAVIPLFLGVPALIAAEPGRAALVFAVAVVSNFGVNFLLRAVLERTMAPEDAGAYALVFANRTVALYAAALPHDPRFALFVALYQVPILFTALVLRAFPGRSRRLTGPGTKPTTR